MTPTQFSNLALSQLPSVGIVNLDEASLPARTCKLWYQQTVDELLEMGPWRFQIEREVLAELPGNDREAQWLYAFAPPSGAAYIIQVMDETGLGSQAYEYSGDIIYTNVPNATAEFVSNDPGTLATLARARFRGALIAMLAARICLPITKDLKRAKFLADAAEVATERAQAANHNERDNRYGDHIPDIVRGRLGLGPLDQRQLEGPEAVYPDFDPVGTFEGELG